MIGQKLLNKTKNATVAEPKLFHQLTNPNVACDLYQLAQQSTMYKSTKLISENAQASIHNMLS
jgi:hypothetical protein